ncbi:LOW QUALITY PROTEIN: hypothetical protein V2J09_003130 [Rumex salicifolius]
MVENYRDGMATLIWQSRFVHHFHLESKMMRNREFCKIPWCTQDRLDIMYGVFKIKPDLN